MKVYGMLDKAASLGKCQIIVLILYHSNFLKTICVDFDVSLILLILNEELIERYKCNKYNVFTGFIFHKVSQC